MIASRALTCRTAAGLIALFVAGCAHEPAFRAELPETVDAETRAIAVIGDLQQTPGFVRFVRRREETRREQLELIDDLKGRIDDLGALVIVGDLVYSARSDRDWKRFDALVSPFAAAVPVLPAIGNHDYPCILIQICRKSNVSRGMLQRFPWFVPGQPYAVDAGDLRLLFLDSETGLEGQGTWLAAELDAARGRYAAALVFFHRPPFTNSIDWGSDPSPDLLDNFVPPLERAGLPVVVFNGHLHGFEYLVRDGVHYVTTAGGGGPRGAMSDERPFDRYRGPDCLQQRRGTVFRPFNYVLLRRTSDGLAIEVRGFCGGDAAVVRLDSIEIPL
ncbi:MAG TPA: metallophosphoesterase [Gammaproteobacteria bacterium]|nr:metallophosphoesterase [Gammaproteobacteria bacterium]